MDYGYTNPAVLDERAIERSLAQDGFLNRQGIKCVSIENKGTRPLATLLRGPRRHGLARTRCNGANNNLRATPG
jgi:hypothetical protein